MSGIRATVALVVIASSGIVGQTGAQPQPTYRFIKASNMGKLGQRIVESGSEGYGVQFVGRCPGPDVAVLLRRDGVGARTNQFVEASRYATFMKELNDAGSQGFKLIRGAATAFYPTGNKWVAALERRDVGLRFTYSGVQANDEGLKALVELSKRGATLSAGLGDRFILEEVQGAGAVSAAPTELDYRILSTEKTSTLENEIKKAASEGFRAIESALSRVAMARDRATTSSPAEYRLIAMRRVSTAERELQAASSEGFRLEVVPQCTTHEGMFVLQKSNGTAMRFDYRIAQLKADTADGILRAAEAHGYHVAALLNELVVLERQLPD